jgi:hypothetical protein
MRRAAAQILLLSVRLRKRNCMEAVIMIFPGWTGGGGADHLVSCQPMAAVPGCLAGCAVKCQSQFSIRYGETPRGKRQGRARIVADARSGNYGGGSGSQRGCARPGGTGSPVLHKRPFRQ